MENEIILEVCNIALDKLGWENVISIDTNTKVAQVMKRYYNICRKMVLRAIKPSFAIKRIIVAVDSNFEPAYGLPKGFKKPNDCVFIRSINDPMDVQDYQVEGARIYPKHKNEVRLNYIYDCNNWQLFQDNPEFIEAFASLLASKCAMSISQNNDLVILMEQQYKQAVSLASAYEAENNTPIFIYDHSIQYSMLNGYLGTGDVY